MMIDEAQGRVRVYGCEPRRRSWESFSSGFLSRLERRRGIDDAKPNSPFWHPGNGQASNSHPLNTYHDRRRPNQQRFPLMKEPDSAGNGRRASNSLIIRKLKRRQSEETRSVRWDCDLNCRVLSFLRIAVGRDQISQVGLRHFKAAIPSALVGVGRDQISQVGLRLLCSRCWCYRNAPVGRDQISQVGLRLGSVQSGVTPRHVGRDQISQVGLRLYVSGARDLTRSTRRKRPDQSGGIATGHPTPRFPCQDRVGRDQISQVGLRPCRFACPYRHAEAHRRKRPDQSGGIATSSSSASRRRRPCGRRKRPDQSDGMATFCWAGVEAMIFCAAVGRDQISQVGLRQDVAHLGPGDFGDARRKRPDQLGGIATRSR